MHRNRIIPGCGDFLLGFCQGLTLGNPNLTKQTMSELLKVVQQGMVMTVPSQKSESGQTTKCDIVLKKFGGRYADEFLATLWGNDAGLRFSPGDLVQAELRFSVREVNVNSVTQRFQDISVVDILKF